MSDIFSSSGTFWNLANRPASLNRSLAGYEEFHFLDDLTEGGGPGVEVLIPVARGRSGRR